MDQIMSVGQTVEYSADVYCPPNGLIGVIRDVHYVDGAFEYEVEFIQGDYGRITANHLELVDEMGSLQVIEHFCGFIPENTTVKAIT